MSFGPDWELSHDQLEDMAPPVDEDCDHEYTVNHQGSYEWCQKCDSVREIGDDGD